MSCNFTEKISSLIDGELSANEAREVERHLLNCTDCEQLRADFLNLRSQIASFESSLQPTVQNRALKKILSTERRVPARGLQWGFGTQAVAFASLLVIGVIIGLVLYQNSNKQSPASKEVATAKQSASPAPSISVEQGRQPAPEATPEPSRESSPEDKPAEQQQPNKSEEPKTPRRAPVKKPLAREPKPGEQFAAIPERVRSGDAETMTAVHLRKGPNAVTCL